MKKQSFLEVKGDGINKKILVKGITSHSEICKTTPIQRHNSGNLKNNFLIRNDSTYMIDGNTCNNELMNDSFGFRFQSHNQYTKSENNKNEEFLLKLLKNLDLEEYTNTFLENKINFNDLVLLTKEDLLELNIKLGPRNRIIKFIEDYKILGLKAFEDCISQKSDYLDEESITTPAFRIKSNYPNTHNEISLISEKIFQTTNTNDYTEEISKSKHKKTNSMYDEIHSKKSIKEDTSDHLKKIENGTIIRHSNKVLEKNYEGLNYDIEKFLKNYKEQKEKSNKLNHNLPKSKKLSKISNERMNNFIFNNSNSNVTLEMKEEVTRNLRDELDKSSSISKSNNENNSSKYSTNNSVKKEMIKNESLNKLSLVNKENLINTKMLKEIKIKKDLIQSSLKKCKNSIEENRKILMLLENEKMIDPCFIDKILIQISDENTLSKFNGSRHSRTDYISNLIDQVLDDTSNSINNNSTVYIKKKLTKTPSYKKY